MSAFLSQWHRIQTFASSFFDGSWSVYVEEECVFVEMCLGKSNKMRQNRPQVSEMKVLHLMRGQSRMDSS